ncbi:ABC transporter ATP-binding protein [Bifidobacterium subtile]|uniref:ABC transporter ATP-binding protein n=1 Tax=Bifidobacterium subtile TaxID=77635 RepID=UPI002F352F49|nr:ABC transporter ATP-binding protein [Bifidobacterium subtile]
MSTHSPSDWKQHGEHDHDYGYGHDWPRTAATLMPQSDNNRPGGDNTDDAVVSVSHVCQSYGKTEVLHDVSLTIRRGEIVALIGPSGSGKTTLVSSIMGMLAPQSGAVQVLGEHMPNRRLLGGIGYMAQNDALYTDLTALENLRFFGTVLSMSKQQLHAAIPQVAGVVGLAKDLHTKVGNFSGGMKRRLSLAIAMISNPPILILDEPTVGIDPELRRQIWTELRRLTGEGKTILLTTHVMEDAQQSDRLIMIRDGMNIAEGTPDAVVRQFSAPTLEDAFIAAGKGQDAHHSNR